MQAGLKLSCDAIQDDHYQIPGYFSTKADLYEAFVTRSLTPSSSSSTSTSSPSFSSSASSSSLSAPAVAAASPTGTPAPCSYSTFVRTMNDEFPELKFCRYKGTHRICSECYALEQECSAGFATDALRNDYNRRRQEHHILHQRERSAMHERVAAHVAQPDLYVEATGDGTDPLRLPHVRSAAGRPKVHFTPFGVSVVLLTVAFRACVLHFCLSRRSYLVARSHSSTCKCGVPSCTRPRNVTCSSGLTTGPRAPTSSAHSCTMSCDLRCTQVIA